MSERSSAEGAAAIPVPGRGGRRCGACSLCCTVLRVDELAKLAGSPCVNQRATGGCAIHAVRPGVCRAYRCLWLRGAFGEEDRPDRLGAVVDFAPDGAGIRLVIEEVAEGTFERSARLQAIAAEHRATMAVRVASAQRVMDPDRPYRLLSPDGSDLRITGDWVETLENGAVVARRRMPLLARWARRLRARVRRWQLRAYRPGGAVFRVPGSPGGPR